MGIFARFFKVGEAGANRLIDKLEKPELMLDQAIRDRDASIRSAREKVSQVIATERQTKALIDKEEMASSTWTARAEKALKAGEEELATQALTRAEEHKKHAESLKPNWSLQARSVTHLKSDLQTMQNELDELKRNKDIIIAQAKTAEVKKTIYEAKASIGRDDSSDLISRMQSKAERIGFEAEAAEEMAGVGSTSLEEKIGQLEKNNISSSVQQRLEAMKKNINSSE